MTAGPSGRTLVVVPTLNERLHFEGVMAGIAALADPDLHVLLVDDDSVDGTWRNYGTNWAAENPRFHLMRRTGRYKGQGSALRDAFKWAFENENEFEFLATIAGNQTDDPAFLPAMLGKLAAGADVVVAQRSARPGGEAGEPRMRAAWLARRAAGVALDDVESGYRALRMSALQRLGHERLQRSDHRLKLELLARATAAGCRFEAVDVPRRERPQGAEFRGGTSGAATCALLWLRRLAGGLR